MVYTFKVLTFLLFMRLEAIESAATYIVDTLINGCRVVSPTMESSYQILDRVGQNLQLLGIDYRKLYHLDGIDAYQTYRFELSFLSTLLRANNIHPNVRFPEFDFEHSIVDFFSENPETFRLLNNAYLRQTHKTGVITLPSFISTNGSIQSQAESFINNGTTVDVYSAPNRYNQMWLWMQMLQNLAGGSKFTQVFEVGSAAGDNLIDARKYLGLEVRCIGTDVIGLNQVIDNPMMKHFRFSSKKSGNDFLEKFILDRIEFYVANIFDYESMDKLLCKSALQNTLILCTNVLFPHFTREKMILGTMNLLSLGAKYLIIGGGIPIFEQKISGHYLPGWHLYGFEIEMDNVTQFAHCVDGIVKKV